MPPFSWFPEKPCEQETVSLALTGPEHLALLGLGGLDLLWAKEAALPPTPFQPPSGAGC